MPNLIPVPQRIESVAGDALTLGPETVIYVPGDDEQAQRIGRYLADVIGLAAGPSRLRVQHAAAASAAGIHLRLGGSTGPEGYELVVNASTVTLTAARHAGLFYGVQTLRQLLPAFVEFEAERADKARPIHVAPIRITDNPRFEWRGAMLDVARHFFTVDEVKRYIDLIALYKFNRLHLHLADDQGWRIEIKSWPNLTTHGGSTEVGGGPGGFFTQAQYSDIVAYARERFITIVPEIDMPGHTNAALASYAELNCDGKARDLYTGIEVGFSALCVDKDVTYRFIDDVVREIASKQMVGWDEIAPAALLPSTIVQHWRPDGAPTAAVSKGAKVIMSVANRAYLDMKYDNSTPIGLNWAANIEVKDAYGWDPATIVKGIPESALLGVEAPIWTETLGNIRDVEYMAFPRLLAIAEIAWSPEVSNWEEFRGRLAAHGPRLSALGVNFYRSPSVPW
jgi:hexosaminidase